ncbi:MAG: hypothetical protein HWN65_03570 [Candidatus Helarchaeota archaeon]|nr:hypothetical protein [Candidatus Helarchaeota archaeon]
MSVEDRIKELEAQLAKKDQTIQELNEGIKNITDKLAITQANFEEQISRIAEEQAKMDKMKDEALENLQAQLNKKVDQVYEYQVLLDSDEGIKDMQAKIKILENLNAKKVKEIEKLNAEMQSVIEQNEKLKARYKEMKGKSVKELESLVAKKEAEIHELTLKMGDLKSLQTELKGEQTEIIESFQTQLNRIKELEATNAQLEEQVQRYSSGLDAQKMKAYDDFVSQLQYELNEVKNQLASSEHLRSEQQVSISHFEQLLGQVQSQIAQQEAAAYQAQQQAAASYQQQAPPPPMQPPIPQVQPTQPGYPVSQPAYPATPAPPAQPTGPASGAQQEAVRLLDTIAARARSGIPGSQLAQEMEQTRNRIVEVFQWHPALFELAAFARRLKQLPVGTVLDAGTLNSLLERIEAWKSRILA